MLSGVKLIPRDQLKKGEKCSELEKSESKATDVNKERFLKEERKKKPQVNSSDDGVGSKLIGKSSGRRRKKKYKFDDVSSGSPSHSSGSDDFSKVSKYKKKEHGRSRKRSSEISSSDDSSSSNDGEQFHKTKRKHRDTCKGEAADIISSKPGELSRKELGLDWMLKSGNVANLKPAMAEILTKGSEPEKGIQRSNPKELNPYLKDKGNGYPDEESRGMTRESQPFPSSVVGDGGASWRLKALKRAKEQAAREGLKLDEVVEERWGSLGNLAVSVASQRAAAPRAHLHAIKDRKKGMPEPTESTSGEKMEGCNRESWNAKKSYLEEASSRHPEMRKPKRESFPWRRARNEVASADTTLISETISSMNKFTNDGSFLKQFVASPSKNVSKDDCKDHEVCDSVSSVTNPSGAVASIGAQELTPNQLAAKAIQLRLKGKHDEAERLMKEMGTMKESQNTRPEQDSLKASCNMLRCTERQVFSASRKREEDADLFLAQKIVKNRGYNLSRQADDEYDYDGDAPSRKQSQKKGSSTGDTSRAVARILTQEQRCRFCFESSYRPKHLVVSIAQYTYMSLPHWQPVTEGHCCILTLQHESATRAVDDNVWEEIRNFKKCLIMMFAKEERDVIFLETVIGLAKQQRHCLVECIPLPREIAKEAPLYFKKAIDEAEDEWSQHNSKKLIRTSREKGLRRSIPKDFPYFHVEFGLDEGFVHVIDDEQNFNSGLGLNVVRGMLQLPEEDMHRRRRHESEERQRLAVAAFAHDWEPFDWTKELS